MISLLWLLFVMPDFSKVIAYFEAFAAGTWNIGSPQNLFVVLAYAGPVVLYHFYAYWKEQLSTEISMQVPDVLLSRLLSA